MDHLFNSVFHLTGADKVDSLGTEAENVTGNVAVEDFAFIEGGELEEGTVNPNELIDVLPQQKKMDGRLKPSNVGRPRKSILDKMTRSCYRPSTPGKILFRCIGKCGYTWSSRAVDRVIRHVKDCHKVSDELKQIATAEYLAFAPSTKLAVLVANNEARAAAEPDQKKAKLDVEEEGKESGLVTMAKRLGKEERHTRLNLAIVRLFCARGLPTFLAESEEWTDVFYIADPTYSPPSREMLEYKLIPAEQVWVIAQQTALLQKEENLTISYDGGTKGRGQAFWTIHVSTPSRKVYFVQGVEAAGESHTGIWIRDLVLKVRVQVAKFAVIDKVANRLRPITSGKAL